MKNKVIMATAILAVMVAMVSVASAETIYLTKTNVVLPQGFVVTVITDTASKTMSVQLTGAPEGYSLSDFRSIKEVYYNLDKTNYYVTKVEYNGADITDLWNLNTGDNIADGFGEFASYKNSPKSSGGTDGWGITYPLIFTLNNIADIPGNSLGNKVAVHLQFGSTEINAADSTWITNIPEFPTIAMPIVAAIGLVFFFQYRKGKKE